MNQVLILSPNNGNDQVRMFFVRTYRERHANIELANKEALSYVQSKFEKAKKLFPELKVVDSIRSEMSKEVLIHCYKSIGYECLNVKMD